MDLNEIVWRAASVYPDDLVLSYWDSTREQPRRNTKAGDTLAEFIAIELADTYDPDASEGVQLATAIGAMQRAINELEAVRAALMSLAVEQLAA